MLLSPIFVVCHRENVEVRRILPRRGRCRRWPSRQLTSCCRSSRLPFWWLDRNELPVKQQVVGDLQGSCNEERSVDQTRCGKHESDKQRRDGGANCSRHPRDACSGRSFFGTDNGHCVGLSCWNIHLTDAEPQQQDSDLQVGFGPELRVSTSITPNAKFLREPGRLKVHPCQH